MFMDGLWRLLHLFFAFSFVGSLVVAEWNGRAARVTQDWSQRALLFGIVFLSTRVAGVGGLVLTGVFGNLASMRVGYQMSHDVWLMCVNGVWLVTVAVMLLLVLPNASRLFVLSQAAARGESSEGYTPALARWRIGNVLASVLYLSLLVLMVFHWHS
jgi:Na+/melibiose symporter-like transporter